jgi:hypothetical protein
MAGQDIWWSYWYSHLPNYAFSVLFYTMLGRFALGLFVPHDSSNYIYRWFCLLTDWIVRPIAFITPRALPGPLLPLFAAFWVVIARILFFIVMFDAGLTPHIAAPG